MIVRVLALIAALALGEGWHAQAAQLPCDGTYAPAPVLCYGMRVQKTGYTGHAIQVYNPVTVSALDVDFDATGNINTTALDGLLPSNATGLVATWFDQGSGVALALTKLVAPTGTTSINSVDVTANSTGGLAPFDAVYGNPGVFNFTSNVASVTDATHFKLNQIALATASNQQLFITDAPSVRADRSVGNARSIIFQGGGPYVGAMFSLKTQIDLSLLGITAKDYSVAAVLRFPMSMFTNQASAPGVWRGAVWELAAPATGNGVVATTMNDSRQGYLGAIYTSDQNGLDFWTPKRMVPVQTVVLTVTSRTAVGVRVCLNTDCRDHPFVSPLTRSATDLFLGKMHNSVAGGFSDAGSFEIVSLNVWSSGLTQSEMAFVQSRLAQLYNVNLQVGRYDTNFVGIWGDSIASGYTTLGLKGILQNYEPFATQPVTLGSYSIPGSTITENPPGTSPIAIINGTQAMFSTTVCETVRDYRKSKVAMILGGGNDAVIGPVGRLGTTTSGSNVITTADTSGLTIGDYVYHPNLGRAVLRTITNIVVNTSVTVSGPAPSTSGIGVLQFTFAAVSPTRVYNGIQAIVNTALQCGFTHRFVITMTKRDADYMPHLDATNALLLGGVSNATVLDCRNFGNLASNPGVDFFDSGHMSDAGNLDMANCVKASINNALVP